MLADQRAADRARIVERGDALFQRLDDPRYDLAVGPRPSRRLKPFSYTAETCFIMVDGH